MIKITNNIVDRSKYDIKCPYAMKPEFIVVHNTANDASAMNEVNYMIGNNDYTSFHYAVDDKEAVQGLPLDRNGFHAGDGANGAGNRKGIAIEICYSKSGGARFTQAEKNGAELVAYLLKKYGWDVSKVKKHQDFSGKYCPHRTLDLGWDRFLNIVKSFMTVAPVTKPKIGYAAHVQNEGWQKEVYDGATAGTTGKSARLEAFKINYPNQKVYAKAHIQGKGWIDYGLITKDTIIGTTGQKLRLEAICLKGAFMYRVHIQNVGWSAWTKADGVATLGSVGMSARLEAIQIK